MLKNRSIAASSVGSPGALREITLLVGLALLIHALVLYFVFPGYYSPLWPFHSDFYMSVALAQSKLGYADYIGFPRPMSVIFLDAIGHFGIRGGMLAGIAIVQLNCALTAALIRRVVGIEIGWYFLQAFAVYVFLVFAHPYFYVFSTYDQFSQLSYLLLVAAAWCLFQYNAIPRPVFLMVSVALALLGFLAKETYGLSALLLAAVWFLVKRQEGAYRAAIPTIAVGAALAIALLINAINGSPFTGTADYAESPYRIVLAPAFLMAEWARYAADGLNLLTVSLLLLVAFTTLMFLRGIGDRRWLVLLMPAAGALAWLPNAALPNHYFSGYSWNGAYLLFAPVLLAVPLWQAGRIARMCSSITIILALGSPILFASAYKSNSWILEQEARQRNLLQALESLADTSPPDSDPHRVLVTGIDFPFTPFDHGLSMRSFTHGSNEQFDVLVYTPRAASVAAFSKLEAQPSGVRFISQGEVDFSRYQRVWAFRSDGTLAKDVREPARFISLPNAELGFSATDLLLFPRLLGIFGDPSVQYVGYKQLDGYQYLVCGTALLGYENLTGAEKCLMQSALLIPENPYPYFHLGVIQEKQGMPELARLSFERAMALDDPKSPNPWFRKALDHVSNRPAPPAK